MHFAEILTLHLGGTGIIAIPLAFAGGVVSAFNPCCLPMIPTIVVLVGHHGALDKARGAFIAGLFVLGFAVSTALMGAVTVALGVVFGQIGKVFSYVIAMIPILMALQLWDVIHIPIPAVKSQGFAGHSGAFFTGVVFALVIIPCTTPIFASILAYAIAEQSIAYGSTLLLVYGLGLGVPLIIMGSCMGLLGALRKFNENRHRINSVTAALLLAIGLYLLWKL